MHLLSCIATPAMSGQVFSLREIATMDSLFEIRGCAQIYGSDLGPSSPHTGMLVLHCDLYAQIWSLWVFFFTMGSLRDSLHTGG